MTVTVVVVDDSSVQRRFVRAAVDADPGLSVVGEARNGRDAVALVERLRPDVVLMDLNLPVMNGMEAIERIMAARPTPILVYSGFVEGADHTNAADALAAGAVDVLAKPSPDAGSSLADYADVLRARLRVAARVRVITHPRGRLGGTAPTMTTRGIGPNPTRRKPVVPKQSGAFDAMPSRPVQVIVIGASTGGPPALATVLGELPADLPAAVIVVQHMAAGFIEGLAGWLDGLCALPVSVGAGGARLSPGTVTIAPSGLNLVVHDHLRISTQLPPASQFHVPGIDATMASVAETFGAESLGVLLTGMGRDGAAGLKHMRDRGAFTIAQDEPTSAVYGMPAAAMAIDAADLQLPLPEVGPALRALVATAVETAP